jgi:Ctf8
MGDDSVSMDVDERTTLASIPSNIGTTRPQPQPILLPIESNDNNIAEWAMIEVNGEFLPPLEEADPSDHVNSASSMVALDRETIELGAVYFRDKVWQQWPSPGMLWVCVQRELTLKGGYPSGSAAPLSFAFACLVSFQKTPILVVGTHELQGVVQELAEPFVCLQAGSSASNAQNATNKYTVTGVVRRKLLFNQYPKTLLR